MDSKKYSSTNEYMIRREPKFFCEWTTFLRDSELIKSCNLKFDHCEKTIDGDIIGCMICKLI